MPHCFSVCNPKRCVPDQSLTLNPAALLFRVQPQEVYVDDEAKLTLHGLVQHYIQLTEGEKNRKLTDLLDALDFNQVGMGWRQQCLYNDDEGG